MRRKLAALLICAMVGGTVASQLPAWASEKQSSETKLRTEADSDYSLINTVDTLNTEDGAGTGSLDISEMVENVMPSVVAITNKSVQEVLDMRSWSVQELESESSGSGIIVGENDDELLICTNNHVVEGANTLSVSFVDDTAVEAQVKGTDEDNDLAVVSVKLEDIDQDTLDAIKVAAIGNSDDLKIGQQVVAIGNALGYGQSVTTGIISALDRVVTMEDGSDSEGLIQTDAAINPGNSGGALLNMKGEVIGINSAKLAATGVEGMGYAIPLSTAEPILERLMNRETREQVDDSDMPYMGITGETVSKEVSELYGVPTGLVISDVGKNTPAEEAGLKKGDVLVSFDDNKVTSMEKLRELLTYYSGGETVEVKIAVADNGEYVEKTLEITLGYKSDYTQD